MKKNKKWYDITLNIILSIGIVFCLVLIVFKLTFIKVVVNGTSMNPSISDGSIGYMVKVNKNSKINRFDVVVSEYLKKDEYYIIKRVLGLPNETIDLVDNRLYVNNQEVKQEFSFIKSSVNFEVNHWELKDNEYLLVGDNRANTVKPVIENIESILAKNGFSYATYDVKSPQCEGQSNYSSCPIASRKWYWFK